MMILLLGFLGVILAVLWPFKPLSQEESDELARAALNVIILESLDDGEEVF